MIDALCEGCRRVLDFLHRLNHKALMVKAKSCVDETADLKPGDFFEFVKP